MARSFYGNSKLQSERNPQNDLDDYVSGRIYAEMNRGTTKYRVQATPFELVFAYKGPLAPFLCGVNATNLNYSFGVVSKIPEKILKVCNVYYTKV